MACIRRKGKRYFLDFYDQHGHRQREYMKPGTTRKQAGKELQAKEEAVSKNLFVPVKRMLLFEDVAKEFLEQKEQNIRANTFETLKGNLNNHFKELAGARIGLIDTATVEKWIRAKQAGKMHINTLRKQIVHFNQVMRYAVRHRYADHNPVTEAERPREQGQEKTGERIRVLNTDQIRALIENTEGQKYQVLFRMAIFTGARQGELLGLKWSDLDLEKKQVHIQRTFTKARFFDVKTRNSNRRIDLGPVLLAELKKWQAAAPANVSTMSSNTTPKWVLN
jgi:integrase